MEKEEYVKIEIVGNRIEVERINIFDYEILGMIEILKNDIMINQLKITE